MAQKLTGLLNLTKIPKGLVGETKKGEKCIFIDIVPFKDGKDEYGNTHNITMYDKEKKETIYLGKLKVKDFGASGATSAPVEDDKGDLPW